MDDKNAPYRCAWNGNRREKWDSTVGRVVQNAQEMGANFGVTIAFFTKKGYTFLEKLCYNDNALCWGNIIRIRSIYEQHTLFSDSEGDVRFRL